ncbi:MAG: DNA internalization-related competence protein ComEC/Rec2 [Candidatus Cloacimonadota bacterium]|nr:MAG: DNA internalization-related competence protein ComEC/Rec2 [Candidatus Cloacimonadota bacterium]
MKLLSTAPLFLPTVIWLLGLITGNFYSPKPFTAFLLASVSLLLMLIRKFRLFALFSAIFFLAVFRISVFEIPPENSIRKITSLNPQILQPIKGKIISEVSLKEGIYRFVLRIDSIASRKVSGKINFSTRQKNLRYGDVLSTVALISKIKKNSNPASFDYAEYLKTKRIFASGYSKTIIKVERNKRDFPGNLIVEIRKKLKKHIDNRFGEYSGFVKAILIGDKSELDQQKILLNKAGLSHLLAVSGLHVGILSLIFFFILKILIPNRNLDRIMLIIILLIYAAICRWSPSVTRAVIMISLYHLAKNLQRLPSSNNILAASLLIITFIQPYQIFSVGLQLSFTAVFVLLNIVPQFSFLKLKKEEIEILTVGKKILNYALLIIIGSFILNLFLSPIILFHFHQLNFNGIIGNLLGIPLMTAILPLALLIVLLPAWNFLISIYLSSFRFFMLLFYSWVKFSASLPLFNNFLYLNELQVILVFIILLSGYFILKNHKRSWKFAPILILLILAVFLGKARHKNTLKITFFDCGLGDLFLIESPENEKIIIDSGPPENTNKHFGKSALPYLRKNEISTIDWVIITHAHNDHYGGLDEILNNLKIKNLVITDEFQSRKIWEHFFPETVREKCNIITVSDTTHLPLKNIKFKIIHPDKFFASNNINNYSIVSRIDFDDFSVLFTGDLEKEGEKYLLANYPQFLDCDVLKVGHHGSKTSSSQAFINAVSPDFAFIPAPKKNRFNFPHLQTLKKFEYLNDRLFIEGEDGALQIETNGKSAHFRSYLSAKDFSVYDLTN